MSLGREGVKSVRLLLMRWRYVVLTLAVQIVAAVVVLLEKMLALENLSQVSQFACAPWFAELPPVS
jgi:hypothetical protein